MRIGTVLSKLSSALRQRSNPTATSSSSSTCPPWTISPAAPIASAAVAAAAIVLRLGMRIRLFPAAGFIR